MANFHQSTFKSLKNWVFSYVLLSKVENMWVWNLQGSYVSWEWKMTKNFKGNWLINSKLRWVIWWILSGALENLKILHFNGLLLTIVHNVWAKKVQTSYIWLHERLIENLKANWLVISKKAWRIWQIFTRARSTVLKLGLFLGALIQSKKCVRLKFTGELCVTRMKNDAKFEGELTC